MSSIVVRRALTAFAVAVASGITVISAASGAYAAAGPWFVATTGNNANTCLTVAAPCASVAGVVTKAGFVGNDTINVAAGTYNGSLGFTTKGAKIVGSAPGVVFKATTNVYAVGTNLSAGQQLSLTNVTLTGGTYGTGGGLFDLVGTVNLTDVTITGNTASGAAATAAGNYGGGIYVYTGATVNMTGGAITNNTANGTAASQGWGGGAYVATNGTLNLDGVTVSNNTAKGATFATAGLGGGVMSQGITKISNSTLANNIASGSGSNAGYGGGIYTYSAAPLTLTNTTISGTTGTQSAVIGGGIASATAVNGTGVTLQNNSALYGGGIYAVAALNLTGSSLTGNAATSPSLGIGGGLYVAGSQPVVLDSTSLTNNSATVGGGGLVNAAAGNVTLRNGSTLSSNTSVSGAGAYNLGTLTITDSTATSNTASFEGGVVFNGSTNVNDHPKATISNSHLDANTATTAGGAVWTSARATTSISGGTLNGNKAASGGAVAIADGATGTLASTTLANNTATTYGGGAILNSGTASVTGSTLTGNTAVHTSGLTGLGGAIWSGSNTANANSSLTVDHSYLAGNTGYAGSTILTYGTGSGAVSKASLTESTLTGNHATGPFGTIEQVGPMTITDVTLTGNSADSGSAGIYVGQPASLGIAGSIIANNSGAACAAGNPIDGGGNLTDVAGCGFSAAKGDKVGPTKLGAPANNGGATLTELPAAASPALDAIPATTATGLTDAVTGASVTLCASGANDQRGTARPQGARCDIGAVEATQVAPTVSGPGAATATVGSATTPITFTSTGSPQAALSATGVPNGLTFTDNGDGTGTISGTPAAGTGGVATATVTATNEAGSASMTLTLTVNQAPTVTGPATLSLTSGTPASFTYTTSGYPIPTLAVGGSVPPGMTLTDNGDGTATLSGTPTAPGSYSLTVTATNVAGSADQSVQANVAPPVPFTTTTLAGAPYQSAYSASLTATGGYGPYAFAVTGGSLPAGLSLGATGGITGTPTGAIGTSTFTVTATDSVGNTAVQQFTLAVTKGVSGLNVAPALIQNGTGILAVRVAIVKATLTGGTAKLPIAGQTVTFSTVGNALIPGTALCSAITDANGVATCSTSLTGVLSTVLNFQVSAAYAGNSTWLSTTGKGPLVGN